MFCQAQLWSSEQKNCEYEAAKLRNLEPSAPRSEAASEQAFTREQSRVAETRAAAAFAADCFANEEIVVASGETLGIPGVPVQVLASFAPFG